MAVAYPIQFLLSPVSSAGEVLVGGQVYFYLPGTTLMTGISVYTEPTIDPSHLASNPFTLDSNGTAQLYINGAVRILIKDADGVTKYDYDNLIFTDIATTIKGTLDDDATVNLPITGGAIGTIVVGDDTERAFFTLKASGAVNIIMSSSQIVANANTDGYFCIGTAVASPVVLRNRLGVAKDYAIQLTYI